MVEFLSYSSFDKSIDPEFLRQRRNVVRSVAELLLRASRNHPDAVGTSEIMNQLVCYALGAQRRQRLVRKIDKRQHRNGNANTLGEQIDPRRGSIRRRLD